MERMREDPAPPAWRAESSLATAGDGSHRAESAPRIPGRSPAKQDLSTYFKSLKTLPATRRILRLVSSVASEVADRLCPFLRRVFTHGRRSSSVSLRRDVGPVAPPGTKAQCWRLFYCSTMMRTWFLCLYKPDGN